MFFACLMINFRWTLAEWLSSETPLESLVGPDLFESIRVAVMKNRRYPTQLILLVEILQATWIEQSLATLPKTTFTFPIDHVI